MIHLTNRKQHSTLNKTWQIKYTVKKLNVFSQQLQFLLYYFLQINAFWKFKTEFWLVNVIGYK